MNAQNITISFDKARAIKEAKLVETYIDAAFTNEGLALDHALICGALLNKIRPEYEYGTWLKWVDEEMPISRQRCDVYRNLEIHQKARAQAFSSCKSINEAIQVLTTAESEQRARDDEESRRREKEENDSREAEIKEETINKAQESASNTGKSHKKPDESEHFEIDLNKLSARARTAYDKLTEDNAQIVLDVWENSKMTPAARFIEDILRQQNQKAKDEKAQKDKDEKEAKEKAEKEKPDYEIDKFRKELTKAKQKEFDTIFSKYIWAKVKELVDKELIVERAQAKYAHAESIKARDAANARYRGVESQLTKDEFKIILGCLHPDREVDKERSNKAFQLFNKLNILYK
jgi:hypothetical protein